MGVVAKSPRLTPIVGEKVWFGPRGWGGWGWQPVSWEGWFVTGAGAAVIVALLARWGDDQAGGLIIGVVIALIVVCFLKGTSPGSVGAKRAFDRERKQQ